MTPVITHRQALAEARQTYDAIYADILGATDSDDRSRVVRTYARGSAAFDAQKPTDARLTPNAAEAFRAYIEAASTGDTEAKLSWLMMMPRVIGEATAATEPIWAATPIIINTVTYILDTSMYLNATAEATLEHVSLLGTVPVRTWHFVFHADQGAHRWWPWTRQEARRRVEAANKQSTLALAA